MKIRAIASAVPEKQYDADEISDWVGADADFIRDKVGVHSRAFLAPGETGVNLARQAVLNLLTQTNMTIQDIDLLVFVTQTPDHGIPQNSSLLLHALEAPTNVAAYDISLGCSGYPYALVSTKGYMLVQHYNRAIIVTCDPYSRIMDPTDKSTTAVFGDAATATMLDSDGVLNIGLGDFGTDGSLSDCLIVRRGRAADPIASIHNKFPAFNAEAAKDYYLNMNGRNVFNFVMNEIPKSINRALVRNSLTLDDIDAFAIHQGSLYMLNNLAQTVGIDERKLLINLDRYGNTVSSSIPLLLEDLNTSLGSLAGKRLLISGFGVGVSWGSLLLIP